MSAKERQRLIAVYKTWPEDELLDALLHREDYLPESVTLIQAELAGRKVVPLAPGAIITNLEDGTSRVELKLEGAVFPAVCPHCLEACSTTVVCSLVGYGETELVSITVPFCAAFVLGRCERGTLLSPTKWRVAPQEFINIVRADDKTITVWIANRKYGELLARLNNRSPSTN